MDLSGSSSTPPVSMADPSEKSRQNTASPKFPFLVLSPVGSKLVASSIPNATTSPDLFFRAMVRCSLLLFRSRIEQKVRLLFIISFVPWLQEDSIRNHAMLTPAGNSFTNFVPSQYFSSTLSPVYILPAVLLELHTAVDMRGQAMIGVT